LKDLVNFQNIWDIWHKTAVMGERGRRKLSVILVEGKNYQLRILFIKIT
jgi:hypothetical protein